MATQKEVLIAIITEPENLEIALNDHWYHIRQSPVEGRLQKRWPPAWIAFYQPKTFGERKYRIEWYAHVPQQEFIPVPRIEIFPDQKDHPRRDDLYYKIMIDPPQGLPQRQIISRKGRRIDFIPTTYNKLMEAKEINDLFDESRLEDDLWSAMKKHGIPAERQFWLRKIGQDEEGPFRVDFLIDCKRMPLVIEVDGPPHDEPERRAHDAERRNALECANYDVLTFTEHRINEKEASYCIRKIEQKVKLLGGYKKTLDISTEEIDHPTLISSMESEDKIDEALLSTDTEYRIIESIVPPSPKPKRSRKKKGNNPEQLDMFGLS